MAPINTNEFKQIQRNTNKWANCFNTIKWNPNTIKRKLHTMMVLSKSKHYITIKFDFFMKKRSGVVKMKISEKNIITQ